MSRNRGLLGALEIIVPMLLLASVILGTMLFVGEATAEEREYDVKSHTDRIVIPYGDYKSVDFDFQKGKKLEIVFTIQVSDQIPIDFWFINDEQYLLLEAGGQFLFFIDGTGQKLTYARKIVELVEHDVYKLCMTNYYSNQTAVIVDLTYEIRMYSDESQEDDDSDSLLESQTFIGHLVFTIIISIAIILFLRSRKTMGYQALAAEKKKKKKQAASAKKNKNALVKKKEKKVADAKKKEKKSVPKKGKKEESKKKLDTKAKFCGECGARVIRNFCTECGEKV